MYVAALYMHLGCGCVEVFKFQFTHFTSVHRIGPLASELLNVELVRSQSDFLIRIKSDTDFSVFNFRMCLQVSNGSHNFSNTGLVVCSQQGMSVGYNQVFSYMILQFRELRRRQDDVIGFRQYNIPTLVLLYDTWRNILARHVRAGIHVCNEADGRNLTLHIGRKRCEQIAIFIQRNVFQSQFFQLSFQILCKHHLLGCTRSYSCRFIRLCVKGYIL